MLVLNSRAVHIAALAVLILVLGLGGSNIYGRIAEKLMGWCGVEFRARLELRWQTQEWYVVAACPITHDHDASTSYENAVVWQESPLAHKEFSC